MNNTVLGLLAVVAAAWCGRARADAPGWVAPLTRLETAPVDPADGHAGLGARVGAIRALGRHGPAADAVPALLAVFTPSEPPRIRVEVALALARRAPPEAVEALAAALDPRAAGFDTAVADAAAHALAAIGTAPALAVLGRAQELPRVAGSVARAIAWLEPEPVPPDEPARAVDALAEDLVQGRGPEAAAGALARLDAGAGMETLVAVGGRTPELARTTARAVAIGLRRWTAMPPSIVARGRAVLASIGDAEHRLLLRALARDAGVLPDLERALRADDSAMRATSARGAVLLGDARLGNAVRQALARENDADAYRRLAEAAWVLGPGDVRVAASWLDDARTAPEALLLAARVAGADADVSLRGRMRRAVRTVGAPRLRVAGAYALALCGDRTAFAALAAALEDASPVLRLAAVRALANLGDPRAKRELVAHARVERDIGVVTATRAVLRTLAHAERVSLHDGGDRVLEIRVAGIAPDARVLVDVRLPDGRVRRLRTLPGGALVIADLPAGEADVQVVDPS